MLFRADHRLAAIPPREGSLALPSSGRRGSVAWAQLTNKRLPEKPASLCAGGGCGGERRENRNCSLTAVFLVPVDLGSLGKRIIRLSEFERHRSFYILVLFIFE